MRLFCVADVHIGNHRQHGGEVVNGLNERCRAVLGVLRAAVDEVVAQDGVLVVCGDLYDIMRPEAQVHAETQEILLPAMSIVVKGNHDSDSDEPGDHALGPLVPVATVVDRPAVYVLGEDDDRLNLLCVPFQSGEAKNWLPDVLRALAQELRAHEDYDVEAPTVLAVHLGIEDGRTAPFLRGAADSIKIERLLELCHSEGIDYVFAGNWHDRRRWEGKTGDGKHLCVVQQIGALVPTGWDNPGLEGYGGLAEFDTEKWHHGETQRMHEIPGPRFVKVFGGLEEACAVVDDAPNPEQLYIRITTDPDKLASVSDRFEMLQNTGKIAAASVVAASAYREAAAASAASSARNADSIDQSLEGYVRKMPLPDDLHFAEQETETVFRDEVLQTARDTLVEAMTRE